MTNVPSTQPTADAMESVLSLERFGRYLKWAAEDRQRALELYTLNTRLSEALYVPLQTLELTLRNRIHTRMRLPHTDRWFDNSRIITDDVQRQQVAEAKLQITKRGKDASPGRIVAALPFGFWTSMVGRKYENLWQTTLAFIATRELGKLPQRTYFSAPLSEIRPLRNRIAHHEPILHYKLGQHHQTILMLIKRLSPDALAWNATVDRFPEVFPNPTYVLNRTVEDEVSVVGE